MTVLIHAIIDVGSNTVRMAIYQIEQGHIEMLMKKKHLVGLAAYIRAGAMQQSGIDKVCEVLNEYKAFLNSFHIQQVTAFTTAALRNATNSREAVQQIVERTGIQVRVISGDEEATYDFIGATHDLREASGLLIDIGGASTEIVSYENHQILDKTSLPVGSLALYTKYAADILPTRVETERMRADVEELLAALPDFRAGTHRNICGIGGTFKGTRAIYNQLFDMTRSNVEINTSRLGEIIARFCSDQELSQEDTILLMKTVPDRMHTILPGMVIADVLAKHFNSDSITYSDFGVREGYIYHEIVRK